MDMIVQNEAADGRADISFTVLRDDLPGTLRAVDEAVKELGAEGYDYDENVSKISVVGLGMATQPGVAGTMFRALAEKGINIQMITTSEIKISVLVAREFAQEALRTVHEAFQLHVPPADGKGQADGSPRPAAKPNAAALVARLQRMEKLIIEGIDLDESQARVTFVGLPDMPGLAAQIVRRAGRGGRRRRHDRAEHRPAESGEHLRHRAASRTWRRPSRVAAELAELLGCPPPTHCPKVAKLSVFGVGMKSHTGVAARMFQSLADDGHQRRVDQHQRGAGERGGRRPRRPQGAGRAEEGIRRRDGVGKKG